MQAIHHGKGLLALVLVAPSVSIGAHAGAAAPAQAPEDETASPFQGIKWTHRTTTVPRPLNIDVLEIDLNCPAISFLVTPGGAGRRRSQCGDPGGGTSPKDNHLRSGSWSAGWDQWWFCRR
jgi:hypothetical protein